MSGGERVPAEAAGASCRAAGRACTGRCPRDGDSVATASPAPPHVHPRGPLPRRTIRRARCRCMCSGQGECPRCHVVSASRSQKRSRRMLGVSQHVARGVRSGNRAGLQPSLAPLPAGIAGTSPRRLRLALPLTACHITPLVRPSSLHPLLKGQ